MIKIFTIIILFFLDLISKKLIFHFIDLNTFQFLMFFVDIAHIHNYGVSFGLFSGLIPAWIFVVIGLVISVIIFYMMIKSRKNIEKWGFLLILAGALSNIIDRALNSYVIDFIYLHYKDFYWPAFNFADIYISIGVCIILFQYFRDIKIKKVIN